MQWYDANARDLPWRHREGVTDDDWPYRVWVSEVMLQQTTVPHATPYFYRFMSLWPHVKDLAAADEAMVMGEWAGLGYYSRARNLIKCARTVSHDYDGRFPQSEAELLKLPGFGPYTAAAVMAFGFGQAANVVDGNIERVMSRLYAVETPVPAARPVLREMSGRWVSDDRAADWPQALMDLASRICRPRNPVCPECPLSQGCDASQKGNPEAYPVKLAKVPKPRRYGAVFVIESEGGVVVERRSDKGLLGGMLGLPHTPWGADKPSRSEIDRQRLIDASIESVGVYEHVFTHFALTSEVWRQKAGKAEIADLLRRRNDLSLIDKDQLKSLPTVFRKAFKV